MSRLKFNSFGNSPKSHSVQQTKFGSQQSFNPNPEKSSQQNYFSSYFPYMQTNLNVDSTLNFNKQTNQNIPLLKKQMKDAISSKKQAKNKHMRSSRKDNSTQLSLMISDISLPNSGQSYSGIDLPLNLLTVQVGVTQQILALKQDKLTLMDQYNKVVDRKYKIQRQLTKLKQNLEKQPKGRESSDVNDLTVFDNQQSTQKKKSQKMQIVSKNQNLKSQFQFLNKKNSSNILNKQTQQQLVLQIENLQQSSRIIKQKLLKIQENTRPDQEKRFETFFPQKKTTSKNQSIYVLRDKRSTLYKQLSNYIQSNNERKILSELINENEKLMSDVDKLIEKYKKSKGFLDIQFLREKVKEQQESKRLFFEDLTKFKQEARRYKQQNQQMRQRLGI